jgi:electron transport complex protein RnfB
MAKDIYRKLRVHLHKHPMGFPATKSGVEIALLKKLFEEEEAKIALALTPKPETPEKIAVKLGYNSKAMADKLDRMARKGLIMRKKKQNKDLFNLEPYIPGIYEFQVGRLDRELIDLHEKYEMEGIGFEVLGSQTPYFRVIPVEKNIPIELVVLPYEKISEMISHAETIAVTNCICRTKQKMVGRGCGHTIQNCIILSPCAEYYLENRWPCKRISKEEALEIFKQAEKEGLVHCSQNTASGPWFICNCCSCCCGVLGLVRNFGLHSRVGRSYYFSQANEDLCNGCKECIDQCNFGAISIKDGVVKINRDFCMGCGLCVSHCSIGALSLIRKSEEQIAPPFANLDAMFDQIGKEKGRSMRVVIE